MTETNSALPHWASQLDWGTDAGDDDFAEIREKELPEELIPIMLFTGFDLERFVQALKGLKDDLPLPQCFDWEIRSDFLEPDTRNWSSADKRTLDIFKQITAQDRKSSKYFKAAQELYLRYPSQDFALALVEYLIQWQNADFLQCAEEILEQNPDWLLVRFVVARALLQQHDPFELPEHICVKYAELMLQKHELHEYVLENEVLDDFTVMAYYQAQAAWYMSGDKRLERALYALNVCFASESDSQEDLNSLHFTLLTLWVNLLQNSPQEDKIMKFTEPLLADKLRRLKTLV